MRVKIGVYTPKCTAEALVDAESIIIDKVDDGLYRVVLTTPSGTVYFSNPARASDIGDLPLDDKVITQWCALIFRKHKQSDTSVTKTAYF